MRILVFDTETTGFDLPFYMLQSKLLYKWPYIVQFSAVIYDTNTNEIVDIINHYIRLPPNVIIPADATLIHGVNNEICETKGVDIYDVFEKFFQKLDKVDRIVAHNIRFDMNIMKAELMRLIEDVNIPTYKSKNASKFLDKFIYFANKYCTMAETTAFCNIQTKNKKGETYIKQPKLIELHRKLFGRDPSNLHNSFYDVLVTLRCYLQFNHNIDPFMISSSFAYYYHNIYSSTIEDLSELVSRLSIL